MKNNAEWMILFKIYYVLASVVKLREQTCLDKKLFTVVKPCSRFPCCWMGHLKKGKYHDLTENLQWNGSVTSAILPVSEVVGSPLPFLPMIALLKTGSAFARYFILFIYYYFSYKRDFYVANSSDRLTTGEPLASYFIKKKEKKLYK